jgi:hypothetical protein
VGHGGSSRARRRLGIALACQRTEQGDRHGAKDRRGVWILVSRHVSRHFQDPSLWRS